MVRCDGERGVKPPGLPGQCRTFSAGAAGRRVPSRSLSLWFPEGVRHNRCSRTSRTLKTTRLSRRTEMCQARQHHRGEQRPPQHLPPRRHHLRSHPGEGWRPPPAAPPVDTTPPPLLLPFQAFLSVVSTSFLLSLSLAQQARHPGPCPLFPPIEFAL
ncbi:PREDICTED: uncharacterized protein LOC107539920 isoform X2 [Miniopterus natalensis]|uniref:uncharacterized protein LOC107539920 isoform X2 n=1 Tax=Miniopterus natalensis TaxID=291302 RepID=UPI0007A6D6F1|nr:PREDICTED: uncharacterized protein LOC107539920 isoform X2 [Miniopterus natalensis]